MSKSNKESNEKAKKSTNQSNDTGGKNPFATQSEIRANNPFEIKNETFAKK